MALRGAIAKRFAGPVQAKYRNQPCEAFGLKFQSKKEAHRYAMLRLRESAGGISDLKTQVRFPLVVEGHKICTYVADFTYTEDGVQIVEDVKGGKATQTPVFRVKIKLFQALYPQHRVVLT